MTMPSPSSDSSQLGALVSDYPIQIKKRLIYLAVVIMCLVFAFGFIEIDLGTRISLAVISALIVWNYFFRLATAKVFERGFMLSKRGKAINVRWEDIGNVSHEIARAYLLGIIPGPKSHNYIVTLTSGKRVRIYDEYTSNVQQLGNAIILGWKQAAAAKREGSAS